jgi:flagellar hook-associated protein 2
LGTGVAIASNTNKFSDVVSGLQLTAVAPSDKTESVDVTASSTAVVAAAQDFVDAYNSIRSTLDDTTSFDSEALTTGILFGSTAALRVDTDLSHLLSGTFSSLGKFSSLQQVGISFDDKGKLSLDKTKLQDAFDSDPDVLSNFFARDTLGVSAKISAAADRLAGTDSVLTSRTDALKETIDNNTEQLTRMSDLLDKQRQRLLDQFTTLETTVAKLQESLTAISSIQYISPLYTSSSSN